MDQSNCWQSNSLCYSSVVAVSLVCYLTNINGVLITPFFRLDLNQTTNPAASCAILEKSQSEILLRLLASNEWDKEHGKNDSMAIATSSFPCCGLNKKRERCNIHFFWFLIFFLFSFSSSSSSSSSPPLLFFLVSFFSISLFFLSLFLCFLLFISFSR